MTKWQTKKHNHQSSEYWCKYLLSRAERAEAEVRKLMEEFSEVKNLISQAGSITLNNCDPVMMDKLLPTLKVAFDLCVKVCDGYYPTDVDRGTK